MQVAENYPRRGMMVLLSDLLVDADDLLRGLRRLRQRGHDVLVLHVLDDDELDFPFSGPTRFEGLETDRAIQLQSAGTAARLFGGAGEFSGDGAARLCPRSDRLRTGADQRTARRGARRVFESSQSSARSLGTGRGEFRGVVFVSHIADDRLAAHCGAGVDPFDQPAAAAEDSLGGDAVSVESERQNKRWILFKQWLLLATRMAAIGAVGAAARPRGRAQRVAAAVRFRHDASRACWSTTAIRSATAGRARPRLGEAKRAVQAIVDQAHQQSDSQLVTLLRFSEAARLSAGAQPEVFAQPIDDNFRSKLEALLAGWEPSQTDVGPTEALKAVPRLPLAGEDQTVILYLLSDFRTRQFASATDVRKLLEDMQEDGRPGSSRAHASSRRGRIWRSRRSSRSRACARPASKPG